MGNAILKFIIQKIYEPDPLDSEIHFGLIPVAGKAKYAFWDFVDDGVFNMSTRDGMNIW